MCLYLAPAEARSGWPAFDLQGHRGARDERPENTLAGFAHTLGVGVSTLELDLAITRDGEVVVSHDLHLAPHLTRDGAGRWLGGPSGPLIYDLTYAELATFDVGAINPLSPYWLLHGREQQAVPGERIPTLGQVFDLAKRHGADVRFNVETKIDPRRPGDAPDPYTYARKVLAVVSNHGLRDRVMVQSFDWRTLLEVRRLDKEIALVALTAEQPVWGPDGLYREVGRPGCSPWMAGLDIDDFEGNYVRAAKSIGVAVVSPYHGELTAAIVAEAHALGMRVVPWTVNDPADIARLVDMGVDGVITDRPTAARKILAAKGVKLPAPVPPAPVRVAPASVQMAPAPVQVAPAPVQVAPASVQVAPASVPAVP
ncbi:MAG: glycerophosphodiester phosphodiesterase [Candidatus Sericytochromatia bacterium]|nr:glycerophosphodiester phosphodiesterase [Candidatus Tanganyikabacteria bacterium]